VERITVEEHLLHYMLPSSGHKIYPRKLYNK